MSQDKGMLLLLVFPQPGSCLRVALVVSGV